jgi:electron transport complex, RnfABCDGE type, B subunit
MDITGIIWALVWFTLLGGVFGVMLAVASKVFAVKTDPHIEAITAALPGANCGGCGFSGCAALAGAISRGEAPCSACTAGGEATAKAVAAIMGVESASPVRMRAQVMCSGTCGTAKLKYKYSGAPDCNSAVRLAGGDKLCPNGCIGHGTCVAACKFDAIKVVDGVAVVDYSKCTGCGVCVKSCPKNIIKLIPFKSDHWVGCMSVDDGKTTRSYCDVGCISCKLCEKACDYGAISVNDFVASIDYSKCVSCGKCVEKCPRKIIWHNRDSRVHIAE